MTINRTTLLDLPLPVTGTESGTWGNITNNGLSQYVDIAVAGMNALTSSNFTDGALTISNTLGTSAATNIAAGSAQYATIKVSSLIQHSTITAPASNRSYRIVNADVEYNLTIKASGQPGITFLSGQTGVVAFTGTDYEVVGVVNAASSTDNAVPRFNGTTGQIIQNSGVTIDNSNVMGGITQLNVDNLRLDGNAITSTNTDGNIDLTPNGTGEVNISKVDIDSGTIDGAVIGGASAAAGSFTTLTTSSTVTHNGGTANGVAFLNGSKVLTAESALSFNGTVLQNTQSSAADGIMMGLQNTTTGSFIQFSQPAVANLLFGCPNADAFVWKTFGSGTYPERMRIDSSGNVGIGTSSPAAKIEVVGGTGQVFVGRFRNGDATGANNSGVDILCTSSATAGNRVAEIVLDADGANSSGSDYLAIQKTGNSGDAQISQVSNAALIFKTNNTERMRITSDGKVAVGTTTPYGKLNVSGGTGDDLFAVSGYVGGETNYNMTIRNPSTSVISFRQRWFTASQNDVEVMNFGSGDVNVIGALSKGSGSFKINHPLKPETHHLIHSFIEGPQADLIYRGKVQLVAGRAEVNIDTVAGMTEGTFVALNREVQCFTSNESDWDAVRGSVSGNILTIECQNAESNATISWMVIGERQDQHMYDTNWTDENGKVIVEPLKPVKEEVEPTDDAEDAALEGV
jgi:hypothetical protein